MKKFLTPVLAASVLCFAMPDVLAQYQVTTLGSAVVYENFNSYRGSAATLPSGWTLNTQNANNTNLYRGVGNGSSSTAGYWAYGVDNTDRSLGYVATGASGVNMNATMQFVNTSGSTITSFVLSYLGEEWRRVSGSSSQFTVFYGSTLAGATTALADSTWSPANGANANGSLISSSTINAANTPISISNGDSFFLRFAYLGGAGSREGISIDDITVTFNGGGVEPGPYWSEDVGGGGTGTWTTAGTNWATGPDGAGRGAVQGNNTLIFGNTAGTVTVDGGVSVLSGMQFTTTGYTIQSSTIALTGANAAANTITTDTGITATISSQLTGTTGMTKAGAGSLILGGANTYSGTTTVNAGTLALDASGSLASSVALATGATLDLTAKSSGYSLASGTTLSGTGAVTTAAGQSLTVGSGATISPATSTTSGTLTIDGLTFAGGGSYAFTAGNITGTAGVDWDLISVNNNFAITADSVSPFTLAAGGTPIGFVGTRDYSWEILSLASGTISGFDANAFTLVNNISGATGAFSISSDGSALTLSYTGGAAQTVGWGANNNSAWMTTGNWGGSAIPSAGDIASFGVNPNPNGDVGINLNSSANNFGLGNQAIGAIEVTTNRVTPLTINNSSGSASGVLTLIGATVNQVDNVVLRNNSGSDLTLANGATQTMGVVLDGPTNVVVIDGAGDINISSAISGTGNGLTLTGAGSGVLTLSGANTYTGPTSILDGQLILSLTGSLTSDVTVGALGAIGGRGTITGDLFLASGADFVFDLNGPLVVNSGIVSFGGLSIADIVGLTSATAEGVYTLIGGTATFDLLNVSDFGPAGQVSLGDGKFAFFKEGSLQVEVIPEPSTYALLALAGAGFAGYVIRRRRR